MPNGQDSKSPILGMVSHTWRKKRLLRFTRNDIAFLSILALCLLLWVDKAAPIANERNTLQSANRIIGVVIDDAKPKELIACELKGTKPIKYKSILKPPMRPGGPHYFVVDIQDSYTTLNNGRQYSKTFSSPLVMGVKVTQYSRDPFITRVVFHVPKATKPQIINEDKSLLIIFASEPQDDDITARNSQSHAMESQSNENIDSTSEKRQPPLAANQVRSDEIGTVSKIDESETALDSTKNPDEDETSQDYNIVSRQINSTGNKDDITAENPDSSEDKPSDKKNAGNGVMIMTIIALPCAIGITFGVWRYKSLLIMFMARVVERAKNIKNQVKHPTQQSSQITYPQSPELHNLSQQREGEPINGDSEINPTDGETDSINAESEDEIVDESQYNQDELREQTESLEDAIDPQTDFDESVTPTEEVQDAPELTREETLNSSATEDEENVNTNIPNLEDKLTEIIDEIDEISNIPGAVPSPDSQEPAQFIPIQSGQDDARLSTNTEEQYQSEKPLQESEHESKPAEPKNADISALVDIFTEIEHESKLAEPEDADIPTLVDTFAKQVGEIEKTAQKISSSIAQKYQELNDLSRYVETHLGKLKKGMGEINFEQNLIKTDEVLENKESISPQESTVTAEIDALTEEDVEDDVQFDFEQEKESISPPESVGNAEIDALLEEDVEDDVQLESEQEEDTISPPESMGTAEIDSLLEQDTEDDVQLESKQEEETISPPESMGTAEIDSLLEQDMEDDVQFDSEQEEEEGVKSLGERAKIPTEEIYKLLEKNVDRIEISRKTGLPVGEIDLLRDLVKRGKS